jgi:hypothetical protein
MRPDIGGVRDPGPRRCGVSNPGVGGPTACLPFLTTTAAPRSDAFTESISGRLGSAPYSGGSDQLFRRDTCAERKPPCAATTAVRTLSPTTARGATTLRRQGREAQASHHRLRQEPVVLGESSQGRVPLTQVTRNEMRPRFAPQKNGQTAYSWLPHVIDWGAVLAAVTMGGIARSACWSRMTRAVGWRHEQKPTRLASERSKMAHAPDQRHSAAKCGGHLETVGVSGLP